MDGNNGSPLKASKEAVRRNICDKVKPLGSLLYEATTQGYCLSACLATDPNYRSQLECVLHLLTFAKLSTGAQYDKSSGKGP